MSKRVRVGIAGLGFGAEFIPIYQAHPDAELVALARRSESELNIIANHFGVESRYTSFESMIRDPSIDAIHINTPIADHANHSIAALLAGKHVACTVPMAISLEDCARVVRAAEQSGKTYMMMETSVYTREFLYAKELLGAGLLGRIQFLRGSHIQDMTGWPDYWKGLAPMHYATHAIAPLLALANDEAKSVRCFGSGKENEHDALGLSKFAVECGLFTLRNSDASMLVTRSLFDVAREYVESFDVYGELGSYEWQQLESELPVVFVGEHGARVEVPDYAQRLPSEIQEFTTHGVYDSTNNQHLSFTQGSGHGGSHPHLVHEFIRSVVEGRPSFPDIYASANWSAAGICAHESATHGMEIDLPKFSSRAAAGQRRE